MCSLYGWTDYAGIVPHRILRKLTQALANAAEERGTDAAGISYVRNGEVVIYKRPKPAHKLHFNPPEGTRAVMGHTRMTTQSNEKFNYNNHPFAGFAGDTSFAFAHNGVRWNDKELRKDKFIPDTHIETDSYAACQLIESQQKLDFDSLRYMAETVEGNFTFTVLDDNNSLYIIKGSNPMCLLHFTVLGLYVYASTESIMKKALKQVGLHKFAMERVETDEGDILRIDKNGEVTRSEFEPKIYRSKCGSWYDYDDPSYGTPDELRTFVNECHKNHIGVIMDFVPVHFAVNDYALWNYDGTALYEYPHVDVGYSEWGSCNFMHSRGEVRSFLQLAAYYWLREFHFDGLRFDAVSNLLYWQGNKERGENKAAIEFIKKLNSGLKERFPDVMLIAEDSSAFPNVTGAVSEGGLGFDYKWDMGWMNDTLDYFRLSPQERSAQYHKLTFSMMYFHSERFILPFSHDENVHGKATIIQKMNGDYDQKFPQARALYLYMYAHPGKKLNFMGGELAQFREWDEKREQDHDLIRYPIHDAFYHYMHELNRIYLNCPALWNDYSEDGFEWIDCHLERKCVYSFLRRSKEHGIIAVFNFSDSYTDYALKLDDTKRLTLLIDTDEQRFGGNTIPDKTITVKDESAILSLPPFRGGCMQ